MAVSKANISPCGKPQVAATSKWGKPIKGQGTRLEVTPAPSRQTTDVFLDHRLAQIDTDLEPVARIIKD